ncbi:MAG: hypothetical protein IKV77_04550, partial [Alistipes sp.]|nr:hypothetical protein [Alistipes sp.]
NGIWSLKKPIRLQNNPFPTGEWYRGTDTEPCGFSIVNARATSFQELAGKYDDDMNGWEYLAPRGDDTPTGSIEHYRIHDFAGFYPKAMPMSMGFSIKNPLSQKDTKDTVYISNNLDDGRSLTWADFPKLKDFYFGVLLYNNEGTKHYIAATSTTSLVNGGTSVDIDASKLYLQDYKVCPFISSHIIEWNAVPPADCDMYTIPKEKVQEVTVIKSSLTIRITTTRTVTSTSLFVNWDVKVSNKDDEAIEIDNNNIEIYRSEINMAENERVTIPKATVAAYAVEQSIGSGTIEMNHENFMKMTEAERKTVELWALVTLQSGSYQANQQVLMDLTPAPKTL